MPRSSELRFMDDPLPVTDVFNEDYRRRFDQSNDLNPPASIDLGEELEEVLRRPSEDDSPLSGSSLILTGSGSRLKREEERALNLYLARHGGTFQGHTLFKISWAAEDNYGLLKGHLSTCSKCDPADFDCGCPISTEARIPLCFHPAQQCYHLLCWQPPTGDESIFAELVNPAQKEQARREAREGSYSCVMHFCEPAPPYVPFNPTAPILETIVPIIKQEGERYYAAMHGARAVLEQERTKRANQIKEQREKEEKAYEEKALRTLEDTAPAFDGAAFEAMGTEKRRQESDLGASDALKDRSERVGPEFDNGQFFSFGKVQRKK